MKRILGVAFVAALALSLAPLAAQATILTYEYISEFSGATPPAGPAPWLTATFDDSFGGSNTVRLTMAASGLTDQEHVTEWLFNFDLNPTQLTFNEISVPTSDQPDDPNNYYNVYADLNKYKADGDGRFDIQFLFPPPPGKPVEKFTAGEQAIYDITYPSPITVADFYVLSYTQQGDGLLSAAHVQGIGEAGDDSGWVTTPEPGTLLLLGSGLAGLAGYGKLRFRRKRK